MDARFTRIRILGKGSFGSATLCKKKADGQLYVIKEVDISRMAKAERDGAYQEAQLLMALDHPNIVRCHEAFVDDGKLCIVMDYCCEGDLNAILQKRKGQPLPEPTAMDFFVQMCLALNHVHDRKILHRDIKSHNVFLTSGGIVKIGDFGVSKVLGGTWAMAATAVGTPYYLSPEICQGRKYGYKTDVWSLGCVLYEMLTTKPPFNAPNLRMLISKIIRGTYPPLPLRYSADVRGLVDSLLTLDATRRPSINDVLSMPVVKARIARFLGQALQGQGAAGTPAPGKAPSLVGQPAPAAGPAAAAARAAQGGGGARVAPAAAPPRVSVPAAGPAAARAAGPRLSGPGVKPEPRPNLAVKPPAATRGPAPAPAARPPPAAASAAAPPPAPRAQSERGRPPCAPAPPPAARASREPSPRGGGGGGSSAAAVPGPSGRAESPSPIFKRAPSKCPGRASSQASSRAASPRGPSPRSEPGSRCPSPRGAAPSAASGAPAAKAAAGAAAGAGAAGGLEAAARAVAAARAGALLARREREELEGSLEAGQAAQGEQQQAAAQLQQQREAAAAAALLEMERLRLQEEEEAQQARAEAVAAAVASAAAAAAVAPTQQHDALTAVAAAARHQKASVKERPQVAAAAGAPQACASALAQRPALGVGPAGQHRSRSEPGVARGAAAPAPAAPRPARATAGGAPPAAAVAAGASEALARRQASRDADSKARAEEAAKRRQAAAVEREREQDAWRAELERQRREFLERKAAAAANRQRVQQQPGAEGGGPQLLEDADEVAVEVYSPPRPRARQEWADPAPAAEHLPLPIGTGTGGSPDGGAAAARRGCSGGDSASEGPTPEQRRRVWEEMRAAAARNRQQAEAQAHGGLASFLGVPQEVREQPGGGGRHKREGNQQQQQQQQQQKMATATTAPVVAAATANADSSEADSSTAPAGAGLAAAEPGPGATDCRGGAPPGDAEGDGGGCPWERRRRRLEADRAWREAEVLAFQRRHWLEIREAAARNKAQVLGELVAGPGERQQQQQQQQQQLHQLQQQPGEHEQHLEPPSLGLAQGSGATAAAEVISPAAERCAAGLEAPKVCMPECAPLAAVEVSPRQQQHGGKLKRPGAREAAPADPSLPGPGPDPVAPGPGMDRCLQDFAAMVADMQGVIGAADGGYGGASGKGAAAAGGDGPEGGGRSFGSSGGSDSGDGDVTSLLQDGHFTIDGREVALPVAPGDSAALKIEALREFIEGDLGTELFVSVYRRLEALSAEDDDEAVSHELLELLGPERLPYLQLIHQLIVCEEGMQAGW